MMMNNQGDIGDHLQGINRHYYYDDDCWHHALCQSDNKMTTPGKVRQSEQPDTVTKKGVVQKIN